VSAVRKREEAMQKEPSTLSASFESDLEAYRLYVDYHLPEPKEPEPSATHRRARPGPAITVAAETGSGADELAKELTLLLQAGEPIGSPPWTVFDRQLVEKMLEEHHLPARLARLMPEDKRSYLDDVLDEILGLRPPSWELIPSLVKTVLHLAYVGHVILVGRGAGFITEQLPNVFHVRLIASLSRRIERVQKLENLSAKEAGKFIAKTDRGRGRFLKAHFHARIDDDLRYHLVVNTDRLPVPEAAELIANGARRRFRNATEGKN
jgi:hypothetical protein